MADITINNSSWMTQFSTAEQQQIAQALGYKTPAEVPSTGTISASAIVEMMNTLPTALSSRVFSAMGVDASNPQLEDAKTDRNEFSDRLLRIMVLMELIEELQTANAKSNLETKEKDIKEKMDERLEQLKEANEKMKKAQKSGLFMKIFGWVAMAIALVVSAVVLGAAVVASGGGATPIVVAAIALAITAISATIMVMEQTGVMEKALTAMFGDNEKAKMGFSIGLQVALIIASLCTLGVGIASAAANTAAGAAKGAAQGVQIATKAGTMGAQLASKAATVATQVTSQAGKAAQLAAKFAKVVTMIADKASQFVGAVAKNADTIQKVAGAINAVMTGAQGVGSGVNAYFQYDAAMAKVEVMNIDALLELLNQLMEEFMEFYQNSVQTTEDAKGKLGDAMTAYQNATMSIMGSTGA